jgi:guanylate kinase|tara:strand:- start:1239 stop:1871 length:633 start_codon:yes stop_codon:yes gene_type:complete
MSSKEDGIMVILSSPSGAGKTTLSKLLSKKKNFYISVSHTTRKPRIKEVNAKDYYFIKQDQFKSLIKKKEFLEHAKVFNNYYGTSKSSVINNLEKGKNVIFDIDWQGTELIKKKKLKYKLITFFILPPSKKALFDRLSNRDMKDKLIVEERMKQFNKDVLHWKNYDYVVINDNLKNCYKEVNSLIESEVNKTKNNYNTQLVEKHVNQLVI